MSTKNYPCVNGKLSYNVIVLFLKGLDALTIGFYLVNVCSLLWSSPRYAICPIRVVTQRKIRAEVKPTRTGSLNWLSKNALIIFGANRMGKQHVGCIIYVLSTIVARLKCSPFSG